MPKSENTRWFAEEVQPHEPSLRSYLRAVFPSFPDVDDLVQESYARLIRARETGRVGYAKAFLYTTATAAAHRALSAALASIPAQAATPPFPGYTPTRLRKFVEPVKP